MQNKTQYSKITFDDEGKKVTSYQVKKDELILIENIDEKMTDTSTSEEIRKTYYYFDKWVDSIDFQELQYVPTTDTTMVSKRIMVNFQVTKTPTLENLSGTVVILPLTFFVSEEIYIQNAYSEDTKVSITSTLDNKYICVNNKNQINLVFSDIRGLENKIVKVELDVYKDCFYVKKLGKIKFELEFKTSHLPSGD